MPIHQLRISLSVAVIIASTIIGLTHYGVQFFAIFIPEGTPLMLIPLIVLIEFVSYIARALSLGIRLGANIIAGHSLCDYLLLCIYHVFSTFWISPIVSHRVANHICSIHYGAGCSHSTSICLYASYHFLSS